MCLFRCVLRSRQMLEWKGKCASFSVRLFASHQRLSRHAHESHHPRAINSVSIHDLVRVLDFEPACKVERLSIHKVALLSGVDGIEPPLPGHRAMLRPGICGRTAALVRMAGFESASVNHRECPRCLVQLATSAYCVETSPHIAGLSRLSQYFRYEEIL